MFRNLFTRLGEAIAALYDEADEARIGQEVASRDLDTTSDRRDPIDLPAFHDETDDERLFTVPDILFAALTLAGTVVFLRWLL